MKAVLSIPKISTTSAPGEIPSGAAEVKIAHHNWADKYPYAPEAKAFIWHNGDTLFISYEVDEAYVAALAGKDNGEVWKDSCAEFFVAFDNEGYYNLEANCAGKVLLSHRKDRKTNVMPAGEEVLSKIVRRPSLGTEPFACKKSDGKWLLTLAIPAATFFRHDIDRFDGLRARCNFYKCGDNLPEPHFMSWQPVKTETPDFHRPEFFADVVFEN